MERIDLQGQPLDLDITLGCGQAFRWRKCDDGLWRGVVRDKLVELATDDGSLLWRTYPDGGPGLVNDYLRLSEDINGIYEKMSERDPLMKELSMRLRGLRLLRQDPTEALISFVCSAANSIPRIMAAIEGLAEHYGDLVCEKDNLCYFAFPTLNHLIKEVSLPAELSRALGFRGRTIRQVARHIIEQGDGWLLSLRNVSYPEARDSLMQIMGVGRKIADCVCLFSLDKDEAVPVDTHVRQLAHKYFLPDLKAKTVTDAVYKQVVDAFTQRYGENAGWAQEFLFYEDLLRTRALGRGIKWEKKIMS
ncbi:MAG: hypothetical protein NT018_08220 [Armatimonadetes bacterium]|nr:hypothetical protein [Armatimonadota bacterium]